MELTTTPEVDVALAELDLSAADVASWREEGYTLIVLTKDGAKHRLTRHTKIAEDDAARAKEDARKQREAEGRREDEKEG
jgi:hypothetical protein